MFFQLKNTRRIVLHTRQEKKVKRHKLRNKGTVTRPDLTSLPVGHHYFLVFQVKYLLSPKHHNQTLPTVPPLSQNPTLTNFFY